MYQRAAYISVRPVRISDATVRQELVEPSIERNSAAGITACLWHDSVNFFQVLEGPYDAVAALLARIRVDHRHYGMNIIADYPVAQRAFPNHPLKLVPGRSSDPVGKALTQALERAGPMAAELVRSGGGGLIEGIPEADRADPARLIRWRSKASWLDQTIAHLAAAPDLRA